MKKTILIAVLFLLVAASLKAKTIVGKVKDAEGNPLPGASVLLEATTIQAVTDFDGVFQIKAISQSSGQIEKIELILYTNSIKSGHRPMDKMTQKSLKVETFPEITIIFDQAPINLNEFNICPPEALFGSIRCNENIIVDFSLLAKTS